MDKAVKLLDEHLKAVCEALATWKTDDVEKYSEQISRFEEMKLSYTNAIKILTTKADTGEKQCNLPVVVCSTWLFFYEGEKDKPQFKVQANTQWEAYQIAEETYGPQVEDMMYCMI